MSARTLEKRCRVCGTPFTGTPRSLYCSEECRRRAINRVKRERRGAVSAQRSAGKTEALTVNEVLAWIRRHYEESGVLLSYGKAVALLGKKGAG